MVCMAVKTTLFVDIVIERNLAEKCSSVSLLNITAPPYLRVDKVGQSMAGSDYRTTTPDHNQQQQQQQQQQQEAKLGD